MVRCACRFVGGLLAVAQLLRHTRRMIFSVVCFVLLLPSWCSCSCSDPLLAALCVLLLCCWCTAFALLPALWCGLFVLQVLGAPWFGAVCLLCFCPVFLTIRSILSDGGVLVPRWRFFFTISSDALEQQTRAGIPTLSPFFCGCGLEGSSSCLTHVHLEMRACLCVCPSKYEPKKEVASLP